MASVDIEDVWNMLGFGRMQLIIFFSCCLMQIYITNEQIGLSIVLVTSCSDLQINHERMGWMVASVFLGQFIFVHYFGNKADKVGRRKVLFRTSIMSLVASFISAFMPEFWTFLLLRFTVGIFISGISGTLLTYLSEFTKISLRPKVNNFLSYPMGLSMLYVPAVALFLFPLKIRVEFGNYVITDWRILIIINLLPGIIGACMLYRLPESPKFYLSINKDADAMEVLERCCRMNKGKETTLASLGVDMVSQRRLANSPNQHNACARLWYDMIPLFKGEFLRYMILSSIVLFILFGLSFGLVMWVMRIRSLSQEIEESMILCDIMDAAHNSSISETMFKINADMLIVFMVAGCTTLAVLFISTILFIFIRRRTILLIYTLLAAIIGSLLNVLKGDTVIVGVFIMFVVLPLCSLRLFISLIIDLIPTHLRAKAVAFNFMAGRLGIMVVSLFMGYTIKLYCMFTFNTFVISLFIAIGMIFLLPSEDSLMSIILDEVKVVPYK